MSTSYNTTVKLYSGVPLVKGGTEVLYLSQSAAEGVLASYLTETYTAYYFERENRRYIQIDATFGTLDSVNYISFANMSHGGKIYFAFVDQVVYINDNNTQIEFTIDPFPTFLGDCTEANFVYVKRNTPENDIYGGIGFYTPDYVPQSIKKRYDKVVLGPEPVFPLSNGVIYFAGNGGAGGQPYASIAGSGICVAALTDVNIESILQADGVIIGAYMDLYGGVLGNYYYKSRHKATVTFDATSGTASDPGATWQKMKSGIYNDLLVFGNTGAKQYDIEDFLTPTSVQFEVLFINIPSPMVFVYPRNYRGVGHNVSEGFTVKVPSLPITANATYSDMQRASDMKGAIKSITGSLASGGLGAGIMSAAHSYSDFIFEQHLAEFRAPTVVSNGEAMLNINDEVAISFVRVIPDIMSISLLKNHFDYYGYAIEGVMSSAAINLNDKAYLQTGGLFLYGSEADAQLNMRLNAGIKIRKTFT